ncbi:glycoside hydrolase family 130 protein [Sphingobacterium sp. SRCM116780]|uniref:glycoside hydrolase family 130 protein n=1 Tax=Sphingobacterium sp. SRCM116780 TaxID=2907623 RepID=UPI001F34529D|nr:glycoside hydrolase family 130 protein [Sphingobacterium sp. SRCM116780]UIR57376.1 glycoside hydrolase family 130 protein [Sphingobacterium sp. SRCM116780]
MYKPVQVTRKDIYFRPDTKRVLARFFSLGDERSLKVIRRVLQLSDEKQKEVFGQVLRSYTKRHRSIVKVFERNFDRIRHLLEQIETPTDKISMTAKLLIGSYFTMEYSIEAAALFNPSIVEHPDQTELYKGEKRVIISFRATGEGHVSSIVFRSGYIDIDNNIHLDVVGTLLDKPINIKSHRYHKNSFISKLVELHPGNALAMEKLNHKLTESFTYEELKRYVEETRAEVPNDDDNNNILKQAIWLASSHYEMTFSLDTSISERVIFPISDTEKRGIEDARFVQFKTAKNESIYYATYTAYDGFSILPKLLTTKDFYHFIVKPIHGEIANKGAALFPRKINGKYAMLCRIDGENNYIAYSDYINIWNEAVHLVQEPMSPYEFVQIGNCGSPIETAAGWLIITHAVGPMREYVIGASLLDLEKPHIEIGRLALPILTPNDEEREGYVPNVVYSCGAIVHNDQLIMPYAMSDYASTYATINLENLIQAILQPDI